MATTASQVGVHCVLTEIAFPAERRLTRDGKELKPSKNKPIQNLGFAIS